MPWWWFACAPHPVDAPVAAAQPAPDPVAEPAPIAPERIAVAVPREFRGLWVATVLNLDFPSRPGLTAEQGRAELLRLVDTAQARGFNALVFQVRAEADAVYASGLEPWSRFLTGDQGRDPGYDPLSILVTEAHARGIEVHAWFNPFRAQIKNGASTAANHLSKTCSDALCPWGAVAWLDPGDPEVRDHTLKVIADVVTRYDVDGVHLDDYFYPYPDGDRVFPDADTFGAYQQGGGTLARDAWRRQNVDQLVQAIGQRITAIRPDCRYGISPFGIYRPGYPAGISGMDQYEKLHADPMLWYREGWIDYLAPQLYWSTQRQKQRYDLLLGWWDAQMTPQRPLLVGLDLTKVGTTTEWSLAELETQVTLSRQAPQTLGHIWFRARPVLENQAGVGDLLSRLYASPALPPPKADLPPSAPVDVRVEGGATALVDADPRSARAYVLYRVDGEPVLDRILPPSADALTLDPGRWAVSVVRRGGVESLATRFDVSGG